MTRQREQQAAWIVIFLLFGWFLALLAWFGELGRATRVVREDVFVIRANDREN